MLDGCATVAAIFCARRYAGGIVFCLIIYNIHRCLAHRWATEYFLRDTLSLRPKVNIFLLAEV